MQAHYFGTRRHRNDAGTPALILRHLHHVKSLLRLKSTKNLPRSPSKWQTAQRRAEKTIGTGEPPGMSCGYAHQANLPGTAGRAFAGFAVCEHRNGVTQPRETVSEILGIGPDAPAASQARMLTAHETNA
jgi:hypothetical protein